MKAESSTLTPANIREFIMARQADWRDNVPLVELLTRINIVAVVLVGSGIPTKSAKGRVKQTFTERSYRHYQTLGCIDSPERVGKQGGYGFRHFVQALLVRKLLWERIPLEFIVALMDGLSTAETKRMLFQGIGSGRHFVNIPGPNLLPDEEVIGTWKRIPVSVGIELHVNQDLPKPKPAELKQIIALLETALRQNLCRRSGKASRSEFGFCAEG